MVPEEGAGVTTAHTPTDWLESEEFEPMPSDPIFISADKFSKAPLAGTLSRVSMKKIKVQGMTLNNESYLTLCPAVLLHL